MAELRCGHRQHVRHRPPWELREWVINEQQRAARIGQELECAFCDLPVLPVGATVYKSTAVFDERSVPKGLLANHQTKAGTWGCIVVIEGRLLYAIDEGGSWVLRPGINGVIEPRVLHRVAPQGQVRFRVDFLRLTAGEG